MISTSISCLAQSFDLIASFMFYVWLFGIKRNFSLVSRVFAIGPGDQGSVPSRVLTKTQKWYLIAPLLTQHYKGWIKCKVKQIRERSCASPTQQFSSHVKVVFWSPSTTVANFTCISSSTSSSSTTSSHASRTDFRDSLSPFVVIIIRFRRVFQTTSCVRTELLLVSSWWLANTGTLIGERY